MTSKELLSYCRTRLDDLIGATATSAFSDTEIYSYLSDCQERVAQECLVLRDSSTTAICTLALLLGDISVTHSSTILRFDEIVYTRGIVKRRIKKMETDKVPLDILDGDPSWYNAAVSPGSLTFDRAPVSGATIALKVRRMPTAEISSTSLPQIPETYHRKLVNGTIGYAFMKPDTETYNIQKSQGYFALFKEDLERIKRMDEQLYGSGARFK
jgi:hypothetical protein